MGTLTKNDIVNEIIIQTGQDRKTATDFVEMFIELIKESLSRYGLIKHVRIQHSEKGVRMDGGIE